MPSHHRNWQTSWPWLIPWVLITVILGAIAFVAISRSNTELAAPTAQVARLTGNTASNPTSTKAPVALATSSVRPAATTIPTQAAEPTPVPTATPVPPTPTPIPPTATSTPTVTPTPAPTATPTPTATPDFASLTVKATILNVRSGPGTAYPRIGQVHAGDTFRIQGKNAGGDWWQITIKDHKGWVYGGLVSVTGPTQDVATVEVPPPPTPKPQAQAQAAAAGFFAYGIQIDPNGDRTGTIAAVKSLGINWVKFQLPWKDYEGTPGVKNFPDDIVNDLSNNGINILASIVKAPKWARPANTDFSVEGPPANPQDYANYVGAFAARYCGRVQAIEVWNEQNLWYEWGGETLDARRYVQLLASAYHAIKAACPGIIVVSGAPTPTGATPPAAIRDTTYLEQMYQTGLRNYCDAVGVHPSGYGNPPDVRVQDFQAGNYSRPSHVNDSSFYFRNTMEQYRNIMLKYGDGNKRLWPTEFGWASSGNPVAGYEYAAYNSEQQQGEYIAHAFQMMKNWGFVGAAFLWNLNYNVTEPGSELAAFGIMGRPAYGILQQAPR